MDKDLTGFIEIADLAENFDPSRHPKCLVGTHKPEEIIRDFISQFESPDAKDGKVSLAEFLDYYTDLSVGIASDEQFIDMMQKTWGIMENDEPQEIKDEVV